MTPFSQAVRDGLPRWCKSGQSSLNAFRMLQLLDKPGLSPHDVATLSVLRPLAQNIDSMPIPVHLLQPGISVETLDAYEEAAAQGGNPYFKKVEEKYQDVLHRFQSTPQQLFASQDLRAELVRQGSNPNCVFTSTAIALAHQRPVELREMLRQTPDRQFQVHFRDGSAPQTVAPVTTREIVKNSCAFESGLWMTVLDQAAGNVGMVFRSRSIKKMTGHRTDVDQLQWTRQSTTRRKLTEATQALRVMLACREGDQITSPPGLSSGHCYAVLGYQPETDKILLQDPNGDEPLDSQNQPKDGLADGRFEMTVDQFYGAFTSINYEMAR